MEQVLIILLIAIVAGFLGSLLGLGGGIIVTPALTLIFGLDIRYAIGASIVSVIATSSGSAAAFLKSGLTNMRLGIFLCAATTVGALIGAYLGGIIDPKFLYMIFGILMLYSAIMMLKKLGKSPARTSQAHPMAEKLRLNSEYYDIVKEENVKYEVSGVYGGFAMMLVSGTVSGLLGIGSGALKVMSMDLFMRLPMKVSSATSNFMIGVTAAASAGLYFFQGSIDPKIAAPVALGVLVGATIGTRVMQRMSSRVIRMIFIPVLAYVSIQMIVKGFQI